MDVLSLVFSKEDLITATATWVLATIAGKDFNSIQIIAKNYEMCKAIKSKVIKLIKWTDRDISDHGDMYFEISPHNSIMIRPISSPGLLGRTLTTAFLVGLNDEERKNIMYELGPACAAAGKHNEGIIELNIPDEI